MKPDSQFNSKNDLIPELKINSQNMKLLFGPKFERQLQTQSNLKLNEITNSQIKKSIFRYINSPHMISTIQQRLKEDPFIKKMLETFGQHNKEIQFDHLFQEMTKQMEKKSKNKFEPITFYNDYVELRKEIRNCFNFRKGFEGQKEEIVRQYKEIITNTLACTNPGCKRTFKNNAGLQTHMINYCKFKQVKPERSDDEEPQILSRLRSKKKRIEKSQKN